VTVSCRAGAALAGTRRGGLSPERSLTVSEHTRGGWEQRGLRVCAGKAVVADCNFERIRGTGLRMTVAERREAAANARLAAALPELLEACAFVADMLAQPMPDGRPLAVHIGGMGGCWAEHLVKVALTKAKGA
jgi:hypothetical protein